MLIKHQIRGKIMSHTLVILNWLYLTDLDKYESMGSLYDSLRA